MRHEFPNILNRQFLPAEVPPPTPHLTLASSSAQLALSAAQADFEVRFYGRYLNEIEQGLEYVRRKMLAVLGGFGALDAQVAMVGLIATLRFSFRETEDSPAAHILRTHLRTDVDPREVQDAVARVAVRVRDTYFVNLNLSNYEARVLERPVMPGMPVRFRPWEGRLEDTGLELTLDINNGLEARTQQDDPVVTEDGLVAVTNLLREVCLSTGPAFAETGAVAVETLTASSTS